MKRSLFRAVSAAVLLIGAGVRASAQQAVTVSGHVTSGGAPLAQARVRIDELKIDRTTDAGGRYSFIVPASSVRGQSVRLVVTKPDRRVVYTPETRMIVLTGGAMREDFDLQISRGGVATPVAVISKDTGATSPSAPPRRVADTRPGTPIDDLAGAVDIGSALAGRIPGLQVSAASTLGGSASLVYRGQRSVLAPAQPAIVVDGIFVNNTSFTSMAQRFGLGGFDYGTPLADVDVANVESVQFLSGAEGAAQFGGRGANGVLVIRTKDGSTGPRFNVFSTFQSASESYTRLPSFQNSYGQGLDGTFEFFDGRGGGIHDNVDQNWGPALDGRALPQSSYWEPGRPDVRLWAAKPNNVRNYFSGGRTNNFTGGVQGHNDVASYRVFGGVRSSTGITPRDELLRRNLGAHATLRPSSRFQVDGTAYATESKHNDAPGSGFNEGNPVSQFTRMGRQVDTDSLRRHLRAANGQQISWNYTNHNNPYFSTLADSNLAHRYRLGGSGAVTYAVSPGLTASARAGTDRSRDHRLFYIASGWLGGFPSYTGLGDFSKGGSEGNEIFVDQTTVAARLDGNRRVGTNARFTFGAGVDVYQTNERIHTLGVDSARHVQSAGAPSGASLPARLTWSGKSRQLIGFGEAGMAFDNSITVGATLRNALTSFGSGKNSYSLLPSLRGSVDLVRAMPGLRGNAMFSAITARAGVWQDGGDLSPYVAHTLYAGRDPAGSIAPTGTGQLIVDETLKPEITSGWQLGADATLRSRRITVGVTAYGERTSGVILPVANPTLGSVVAQNVGEVSNRGIEGVLSTQIGNGDIGLQWDMSLMAARNWNTVDRLYGSASAVPLGPVQWGMSVEARRGEALGVLMGQRMLRDAATGAMLLRNGLPLPDSITGRVALGSSQPTATLGFRNSVRYRWVTVSGTLDGRFGGSIFSGTNLWGSYAGTLATTAFRPAGGLVVAGIDVATGRANTTPVSTQNYYHALARIQEPWVYSASFLKLRDFRVTTRVPIPESMIPVENVSLSLVGRNLFTWSGAPNIDPETVFSPYQLRGIEMGQFPATKSVGIQLSVVP